jgi:hypothetical protein
VDKDVTQAFAGWFELAHHLRRLELLQRKEVKSMIRIGRVILDETAVSSVMRENGTGNPVKVTVFMKHGPEHEFNKYAKEAWEYFKTKVSRTVAG